MSQPVSAVTGCDVLDDVFCVSPDAGEEPRRHRVEEEKANEVQPRLVGDDAAFVQGLIRLFLFPEDGQVDPREVGAEPRAPDDVFHLEDALVLQGGKPVPHAHDPRNAFDASGGDVLRSDPNERRAMRQELRAHLAADRGVSGQHAVADEPKQQR